MIENNPESNIVEMYKNRNLGERFSASATFFRQNWKVLLKNLAYVGVPLAIINGFFMQRYMADMFAIINQSIENPYNVAPPNLGAYALFMLISMALNLFIPSVTGAILWRNKQGSLSQEDGWSVLGSHILKNAGQLFLQFLLIFGALIASIAIIMGLAFLVPSGSGIVAGIVGSILMLIYLIALFFITPGLSLAIFPIVLEEISAWKALKKGFKLGTKYWGSTFLTLLLGGLIMGIINYAFSIPSLAYNLITQGSGILGIVFSILPTLGSLIILPIYIIFLGFQYTSIIDQEEGVSVQNRINQFDNL